MTPTPGLYCTPSADPLEDPLPVGVYLPCHLEAVGVRRVYPTHSARLKIHSHSLVHIGVEAHAVEYFGQGVKVPLKA